MACRVVHAHNVSNETIYINHSSTVLIRTVYVDINIEHEPNNRRYN